MYDVYATADGEYVAIGALETKFCRALLDELGIGGEFPGELDRTSWPTLRMRLTEIFQTRTREEWAALAGAAEFCLAPVHSFQDRRLTRTIGNAASTSRSTESSNPVRRRGFSRTPGSIEGRAVAWRTQR